MYTSDFQDFAKECISKLEKELKGMGHVNIIVAGKTGVGKSTLINTIFREKLANTGIGAPVTNTTYLYEKEGLPLRIYDTVGLELSAEKQLAVKKDIDEIINERLKMQKIEEYIHCIWYCINTNTTRFEELEEELIRQLVLENRNRNVPVIVVLTQAYIRKTREEMFDYIKSRDLGVKAIIPILADSFEEIQTEPFGCEALVEETLKILPESVQAAFINAQRISVDMKKKKAMEIVKASVATSFGEGYIPIPFSDAALLVPTQIGMIAGITATFGVSVNKGIMTAIISALAGTAATTIAGKTLVANLLKLIPGVGTVIGGTISGATAALLTMALGQTYITLMEMIVKGELKESDLGSEKVMGMAREIFANYAKL